VHQQHRRTPIRTERGYLRPLTPVTFAVIAIRVAL